MQQRIFPSRPEQNSKYKSFHTVAVSFMCCNSGCWLTEKAVIYLCKNVMDHYFPSFFFKMTQVASFCGCINVQVDSSGVKRVILSLTIQLNNKIHKMVGFLPGAWL